MFDTTISRAQARQAYDTLGAGLDRAARYEARAGAHALATLGLTPGQRALQIGVGTGRAHLAIARAVAPCGQAFGLDLSRVMLHLTRRRCATPLCAGDAVALPFAARSFDRLYCAYLLDLLPATDLPHALAEFARVLRPTGRLALVSLTEGVDLPSRLFVAAWKLRFRLAPRSLGGCRPLRLGALVERAGFVVERREVITQRGFPSEIVVATLPSAAERV
jgi:ubiquinone/menaquinone biosynthesis C-methylase UbiE